ncbi:hypothetical protein [uncultured Brevundimonas sp.]|uniref:hypothetical protein n=1 Tax=uncultured Brevundimonas sp. TaxID=213418 RepID=UPI0030EC472F|tara:strand:- start:2185 stop:2388 length:204 start_codon:yes stop_codon:yes gene_type:complete
MDPIRSKCHRFPDGASPGGRLYVHIKLGIRDVEALMLPRQIEGSQLLAGETVIVESVAGPMLKVRGI